MANRALEAFYFLGSGYSLWFTSVVGELDPSLGIKGVSSERNWRGFHVGGLRLYYPPKKLPSQRESIVL